MVLVVKLVKMLYEIISEAQIVWIKVGQDLGHDSESALLLILRQAPSKNLRNIQKTRLEFRTVNVLTGDRGGRHTVCATFPSPSTILSFQVFIFVPWEFGEIAIGITRALSIEVILSQTMYCPLRFCRH